MILSGAHAGADEKARFRREAEAIAKLQHPNVVQVFEVSELDGTPYFTLEFCGGGSLEKKLNGTPMQPKDSAVLVGKLAEAVQVAHEKQVIHRDLKPANVLLAADGTPKVTDFGLAKMLGEQGVTVSGVPIGTASYMAPEQAKGKSVGPVADVYALGAILYECLTGRPPFRAATFADTIQQVVSDEPVPPRQLNAQVPRDLETIILKCLAKEPASRYASARELGEELRRWLDGRPIQARPVGPLERLGRFVRQEKKLSAALGMTALSLVSLVIVLAAASYRLDVRAKGLEQLRVKADKAKSEADEAKEQALKSGEKLATTLNQSQQDLYFSLVRQAATEFHSGKWERARLLLRGCPDKLRAWEWRYLDSATWRPPPYQFSPADIALSPDGAWIAWGNPRGELILRPTNVDSPPLPHQLPSPATRLAFAADGRWLAVGCHGGEALLFAVGKSAAPLLLCERKDPIDSVAFSVEHNPSVIPSQVTFQSKHLAVAVGQKVLVFRRCPWWWSSAWNQFAPSYEQRLPDRLRSVAFVPGASALITTSQSSVITISNSEGVLEPFTAGAIDPFGPFKALAKEGGRIVVFVGKDNKEVCQFTGHQADVERLFIARSKLSARVRLASLDRGNVLRVWEVPGGPDDPGVKDLCSTVTTGAAALSLDGSTAAWTSPDGTVRQFYPDRPTTARPPIYDIATGGKVKAHDLPQNSLANYTQYVHALAYSDDGRFLVTGVGIPRTSQGATLEKLEAGEVVVWDVASGKVAQRMEGEHKEPVRAVACGEGGVIAWAGHGPEISLWNVRGEGLPRRLAGQRRKLTTALAFSPDGSRLVSAGLDVRDGHDRRSVRIWNVATGGEFQNLDGPDGSVRTQIPINAVAWSRDGRFLATAGQDGQIQVWDTLQGKWLWERAHGTQAYAVAFSHDSKQLATGGEDGLIRLWDLTGDRKGKEVCPPLRGHEGAVLALAFRPGSEDRLASVSRDRTVRVWQVHPRQAREALVLPLGTAARPALAFSPLDGEELAAGTVQGVRRWRAESKK